MTIKTTKIGNNIDYARVADRLLEFRQKNPRASIQTNPLPQADGSMIFQTTIVQDKADENSADATGSARYSEQEMKQPKAFEKLETIATGRALAMLGYLNNGEVATTEEMLDYEEYQAEKLLDEINKASTQHEFRDILAKLNPGQKTIATPFIKARVEELKTHVPAN